MKLTNILKEASRRDFESLNPIKQKQISAFERIIGGKHTQIFDGIHGMVVDIEATDTFGSYRFTPEELKQLLALKIRWIEADGSLVSIGF